MNAALLRMARRHHGVRYWRVPGYPNGAKLTPSARSPDGWGMARHRTIARQAARDLLGG